MRFLTDAICVLGFATAVLSQGEDSAKDLNAMQGAWAAEILEVGGKPPSDQEKKVKIKVVIQGDKYTTFFNDKEIAKGTLKLDASMKPKVMDATPSDGPGKDKVQPGIYELGKDAMKVLFAAPGSKRPTEFKSREGSEEVLINYKRIVKDKK